MCLCILLGKVTMLVEWADALLSKKWDWMCGRMDEYPLDCYHYKSTCGANKTVLSTHTKHVNEQTLQPTSVVLLIICRQKLKPSTKMYVIRPIKQGQRVLY